MITVLIVAIITTIIVGILCKKYEIEFGVEGAVFTFTMGAVIGLFISLTLSNPTVEKIKQIDNYIIKEAPDGNKAYYILRGDDYERFYIDEYKDEDVDEPYIVEYKERFVHTKWSVSKDTHWKYTYIYYY